MRLNEFQREALRTEDMTRTQRDRIGHGAMGLAGEAGETADLLKKHLYFGHDIDTAKIRAELGDVLWYVAVLADAVGLTLNEVAQANVYKLRQRYPIGEGFTAEASKARVDVADDLRGLAQREIASEAVAAAERTCPSGFLCSCGDCALPEVGYLTDCPGVHELAQDIWAHVEADKSPTVDASPDGLKWTFRFSGVEDPEFYVRPGDVLALVRWTQAGSGFTTRCPESD